MASKTMFPLKTLRPDRVVIFGSFVPNGASTIDNTQNEGSGAKGTALWSVARTAAGKYTITFADKYANVDSVVAQLQSTTAQTVNFVTVSKDTQTAVLGAVISAAFTDITAAAGTRVHFVAVLRNSSVR